MRGQVVCGPCMLVQVIGQVGFDILGLTALPCRWGCPLQLVGHPLCIDYAVQWVAKNVQWLRCPQYLFNYWWVGMGALKG